MTKTYSNDLRERVIEYLNEGNGYNSASKLFKVSISAIGRWYRKYKGEGNSLPKKRGGSKRKINLEMLEDYVKRNKDMRLKEAAEEFGVSIFTISYWLKSLGYSYKKKTFPMWKQAKKSEMLTKKKLKI
jgi:transposase